MVKGTGQLSPRNQVKVLLQTISNNRYKPVQIHFYIGSYSSFSEPYGTNSETKLDGFLKNVAHISEIIIFIYVCVCLCVFLPRSLRFDARWEKLQT